MAECGRSIFPIILRSISSLYKLRTPVAPCPINYWYSLPITPFLISLHFQVIMGFEIPTELAFLWRYLKRVYETPAFTASCPADREIVIHYDSKLGTDKQRLIQVSENHVVWFNYNLFYPNTYLQNLNW